MKLARINSLSISIVLSLLSLLVYTEDLRFFKLLELKAYDLKVISRGPRDISNQVVIVAIDELSLREQGRWPWPRSKLALLIDKLVEFNAAVIGIDIFFPEKDPYVPFDYLRDAIKNKDTSKMAPDELVTWLEQVSDSDTRFAQSLLQSDRSVLSYYVYQDRSQADRTVEELNQKHLDLLEFSQYSVVQRFDQDNPVTINPVFGVGMSIPKLMDGANSAGFVTYSPEIDGVVRKVPAVVNNGDYHFPPFSLQVLQQATRLPLSIAIAPFGIDRIKLGENEIPTTGLGELLVNFYGPKNTFQHISATDVLKNKVSGTSLEGKIVLLGATAASAFDLRTTPFEALYPGVEVHANLIENIIQQDFLSRPQWIPLVDICVILVSGLMLGVIGLYFRALASFLLLCAGVAGYLMTDYFLFIEKGWWLNSVYPVFTQLFVYTGITLHRFVFEEKEKRFIKGAFSQYLAPTVVEQVVKNPKLLKLGGERKVLTAFFSDVAGFSTISEALTPEQLTSLLNEYLTEMTDIIMGYEGTVDKFEGDAIIAFFGAPISFEDHARRACLASLDMQERLTQMRAVWKQQGRHELTMRIGLNTGLMVVGNMGSKSRMDYTMMGDSVNLAARLEGVNKQYGTQTMISQFTYELVKDAVEVRELDRIRVMGKAEPVTIYELIGKTNEVSSEMKTILPVFKEGLDFYKKREWRKGIASFEKVLAIDENDGPSKTYLLRCRDYLKSPPPVDWDGVFSMTSK